MNNPFSAQITTAQSQCWGQSMNGQGLHGDIPRFIKVGKEYTEGVQFDDHIGFTTPSQPHQLYSITVNYTTKYVQGIGFKYKDSDGNLVETRHNLCNYFLTKSYYMVYEQEFILGDNDYITRIAGRYGDWLDQLEFQTYLGNTYKYGGNGGDKSFNYSFPNHTFSVASGSYRSFIDHLKFDVIPVPKQPTASVMYPSDYLPQAYPYNQHVPIKSQFPRYQTQVNYQGDQYNYPAE